MSASIWIAFGHVFYMEKHAIGWFTLCSFLLGLGGANFIVYSFWLPEQYGTECRASGGRRKPCRPHRRTNRLADQTSRREDRCLDRLFDADPAPNTIRIPTNASTPRC